MLQNILQKTAILQGPPGFDMVLKTLTNLYYFLKITSKKPPFCNDG